MWKKIFIPFLFLFFLSPFAFAEEIDKESVSLDSEDTTSQEEIKEIEALEPLEPLAPPEPLKISDEELKTLTGQKSDDHDKREDRSESEDPADPAYHFVVGGGYVDHIFSTTDEFRKSTGATNSNGDSDEITSLPGLEIFGEYLLGPMDQVGNLAFGLNYQSIWGVYKYAAIGAVLERKVEIINTLAYTNWSAGIGESKYWRLGGTLGFGSSTYTYTLDWKQTNPYLNNKPSYYISKSAKGTVTKLGFFADWGQDMSGGRMGYNLISTSYDLIDDSMPDGSGGQLFINFRLAF